MCLEKETDELVLEEKEENLQEGAEPPQEDDPWTHTAPETSGVKVYVSGAGSLLSTHIEAHLNSQPTYNTVERWRQHALLLEARCKELAGEIEIQKRQKAAMGRELASLRAREGLNVGEAPKEQQGLFLESPQEAPQDPHPFYGEEHTSPAIPPDKDQA